MGSARAGSKRLAGRTILLTGAASGIGLATARLFAEEGAALALLDRDAEALAQLKAELGAHVETVELASEVQIVAGVARAAEALGGLDGVLNIAGIGGFGAVDTLSLADWNQVLAVNLTAPFLVRREALPHLRRADSATIVNVASGVGLLPNSPGMSVYVASKGGLIAYSKALAVELAPRIRLNVVCPGAVDTPLVPATMKDAAAAPGSPYALKRLGTPDELAATLLFLTSAESSFTTGVALAVDGGRTYH